jgi:hypothetical protein
MNKPGKLLITFFLCITIISCTEKIDIELDEGSVRLVVEGSVSTDTMAHKIILTKTTSYFYSQESPSVTGASVSITTGERNILLFEKEPGIYYTDSTFYGLEGQIYTLNITFTSPIGGHTEYSASAYMNHTVRIDSANLIFHPEWSDSGFYEVQCYLKDPPTDDFYRFLIYKNGKILSDTLDEWFVTDDRFFNGSYIKGAGVAFLDQGSENEKLEAGDEITLELNCLEQDYAGFLWDAQSELRGSNPLFSGPPANVKGNISNGAIGFFAAYTTSRVTIKVGTKESKHKTLQRKKGDNSN